MCRSRTRKARLGVGGTWRGSNVQADAAGLGNDEKLLAEFVLGRSIWDDFQLR